MTALFRKDIKISLGGRIVAHNLDYSALTNRIQSLLSLQQRERTTKTSGIHFLINQLILLSRLFAIELLDGRRMKNIWFA